MTLGEVTWYEVLDMFMLLLIGIGPKIALVPFMKMTATMDDATIRAVAGKAVRTAITWALILATLGWLFMRLLHFTAGAVLVAGGIVLLLLSVPMLISHDKPEEDEGNQARGPMELAVYPLAVPYVLNPVGIAVLVVLSTEVNTILQATIVIGLILLVGLLDWAVFTNIKSVAKSMNESKMAVTEAVFGVLLAALAVQLMVTGLAELGIINSLTAH